MVEDRELQTLEAGSPTLSCMVYRKTGRGKYPYLLYVCLVSQALTQAPIELVMPNFPISEPTSNTGAARMGKRRKWRSSICMPFLVHF